MSYRITAFIIAAGLFTLLLATSTTRLWTENGTLYASSEMSHLVPEYVMIDTSKVLRTGKNYTDTKKDRDNITAADTGQATDTEHATDTEQAESIQPPDTIMLIDEKNGTDIMVPGHFARIVFSHPTLKIIRNGEKLEFPENKELLPGDIIETCPKHFAMVEFRPAGTMTLFPASRVSILSDGSELALYSAEVLFESNLTETTFPGKLRCFDETLHHSHDPPPVSFGVHCRGESGMILTSKAGTLLWNCRDAPCEISAGQGLMGRITTANYSKVMPPAQPNIKTTYVVPHLQTKDRDGEPDQAEDPGPDQKSGFSATIMWNRVDMADQYLVHIYQDTKGRRHHVLTLHHKNRFTAELSEPGRYTVRVMAVDYYGVSGEWSDPVSFTADNDELILNGSEDTLDALSPENPVQSKKTVENPHSDPYLPDNGDRHL